MNERFSATKISLVTLVLAVAIGGGVRIKKWVEYDHPLSQIRSNIQSSQLLDEEKREYLGMLDKLNLRNPSKELREFMNLSLSEKRKVIYNSFSKKELDYLDKQGVIDGNNLSHGACVYLKHQGEVISKAMLLAQ